MCYYNLVALTCLYPGISATKSTYRRKWYLILGGFFTCIETDTWHIMTLAPSKSLGKYVALWIITRNLGQLVGGAISEYRINNTGKQPLTYSSISKNHVKGAHGGVTLDTYISFFITECMALLFALLIPPLERVVRSDGTRILISEKPVTKTEFRMINTIMTSKLISLSALWAVRPFFHRKKPLQASTLS